MENASAVREHPAVANAPPGAKLSIPGVADPSAVAVCGKLIEALASEALERVDNHLKAALAEGRNPYREVVSVGSYDVRYAALVTLLPNAGLAERVRQAFEGSAAAPQASSLVAPTLDAIARRLAAHGYDLCGKETGRGAELLAIAVRDPVYVQRAIDERARALRLVGGAAMHKGMGVTAVGRPEQVGALRALVDELCHTSVAKLTDHLQSFVASQTAPFGVPSLVVLDGDVVPGFRVMSSSGGRLHTVHNAAVVSVLEVNDVVKRLRKIAVDGLVVDEETFLKHFSRSLAERFSVLPSLQVVLVGRQFVTNGNCFIAVCAEKPRRAWLARLRELARATSRPALPPPARALPPPEVVPPVREGV